MKSLAIDVKFDQILTAREDLKTLVQIIKSKIKREKIQDDKTMIMERTIHIVAKLPHNSRLREQLTNTFIEELWGSLDHPPMLYMGDEYKYRQADGSYNVSRLALNSYSHNLTGKIHRIQCSPD